MLETRIGCGDLRHGQEAARPRTACGSLTLSPSSTWHMCHMFHMLPHSPHELTVAQSRVFTKHQATGVVKHLGGEFPQVRAGACGRLPVKRAGTRRRSRSPQNDRDQRPRRQERSERDGATCGHARASSATMPAHAAQQDGHSGRHAHVAQGRGSPAPARSGAVSFTSPIPSPGAISAITGTLRRRRAAPIAARTGSRPTDRRHPPDDRHREGRERRVGDARSG